MRGNCECEHIDHMERRAHPYGAARNVRPTRLRDMGTWHLCFACRHSCQKANVEENE